MILITFRLSTSFPKWENNVYFLIEDKRNKKTMTKWYILSKTNFIVYPFAWLELRVLPVMSMKLDTEPYFKYDKKYATELELHCINELEDLKVTHFLRNKNKAWALSNYLTDGGYKPCIMHMHMPHFLLLSFDCPYYFRLLTFEIWWWKLVARLE